MDSLGCEFSVVQEMMRWNRELKQRQPLWWPKLIFIVDTFCGLFY